MACPALHRPRGISAARPHLGVNKQWPPPRLADYDGIVNGETIIGQAVNDPAPDLDWLPENIDHLEVAGAGDLVGLAGCHPLPNGLLPVAGCEGTCHNTRHSRNLADQTGKCNSNSPLLVGGAESTAECGQWSCGASVYIFQLKHASCLALDSRVLQELACQRSGQAACFIAVQA